MAVCGSITAGIDVNCTDPLVAGANDRLIIINKADIDSTTVDGSNPLLYTDIILASGKVGYVFQGKNFSNDPSSALEKKDFAEVYSHSVKFKVFDNSPATKKQLDLLKQGLVVAIVENNYKGTGGNAAFEIYGLNSGLTLQVHTRKVDDDATQGAHDLELKSSPKSMEPHSPSTLFSTSYAVTKAIVDGLIV